MENSSYELMAQSALQDQLSRIFTGSRFRHFINDLSISLTDDVIKRVKKRDPDFGDFKGAARNVLCEKLSAYCVKQNE